VMKRAFRDVYAMAQEHNIGMRQAAYLVAVNRVAQAARARGIYP